MSDIHGSFNKFSEALKSWNPEEEHLVLMGDLIDRGPDSYEVVSKAIYLKEKYPDSVTVLKGNHEEMFLTWLFDTPEELFGFYYNEEHRMTLKSFLGDKFSSLSRRQRAESMNYNFKKELKFLKEAPLFFETESFLLVHAGVNLEIEDWKKDSQSMLWIRNEFIYSSIDIGKRIFFGHTPTSYINDSSNGDNFEIWINPSQLKVAIDGGASMGGQLNALKISEKGEILEVLKF